MNIHLYGLLHLDEGEWSAVNLKPKDFRGQCALYINNAMVLSNSLRDQDIEFTLLTNRKDLVDEVTISEGLLIKSIEIPFLTQVPSGTRFYSAHFKLDAFTYLSSVSDAYVGLCDLDMVCIRELPTSFYNNIERLTPMFYDISDQVIPTYGHEVIIRDLGAIHNLKSEGRWAGGEFISGTPSFFASLKTEVDNIYSDYIRAMPRLHHVGDEAVVSAALEVLRHRGVYVSDAGTLGIVGRFWNCSSLHPQMPFEYFEKCFLLHLPADKEFLSRMATRTHIKSNNFMKEYVAHRNAPISRFERGIKRGIKLIIRAFRHA